MKIAAEHSSLSLNYLTEYGHGYRILFCFKKQWYKNIENKLEKSRMLSGHPLYMCTVSGLSFFFTSFVPRFLLKYASSSRMSVTIQVMSSKLCLPKFLIASKFLTFLKLQPGESLFSLWKMIASTFLHFINDTLA